jgi:hypothetical protein
MAQIGSKAPAAVAQEVPVEPGSPSATITIDGKYLPSPPPPFGGVINLGAEQSKPFWPPTIVPNKGAPNVLLIMTDDQGYGVSSTFGGVVSTPAMDRIVFDFKYDGPGPGKGGTGVLSVDGTAVANQAIPHTIPILMAIDETFDVGMDTRTPVDDKDYQVPFRFTGKIDKFTFQLGAEQLMAADHQSKPKPWPA